MSKFNVGDKVSLVGEVVEVGVVDVLVRVSPLVSIWDNPRNLTLIEDEVNRCQSRIDIDGHEVQCGMDANHSGRHVANPLHGDGSTLVGRGMVRWGDK